MTDAEILAHNRRVLAAWKSEIELAFDRGADAARAGEPREHGYPPLMGHYGHKHGYYVACVELWEAGYDSIADPDREHKNLDGWRKMT